MHEEIVALHMGDGERAQEVEVARRQAGLELVLPGQKLVGRRRLAAGAVDTVAAQGGVAAVAQNRGIQLRSVESKVEGSMDIRGILGIDSDVRNGYDNIKVTFKIDADASKKDIEALVAQSQKRSAVFDALANPVNITVEVV